MRLAIITCLAVALMSWTDVESADKDETDFLERGNMAVEEGDLKSAIELFGLAIQHDAQNIAAYTGRAQAWIESKKPAKALPDLERALELDPENEWAQRHLPIAKSDWQRQQGDRCEDKREYDAAIHHYNAAIELNAANARAIRCRADVYRKREQYDLALADYDAAITTSGGNYDIAFAHRGWTHNLKKEYEKAILDFDKAIELDPKYRLAYNQRGIAYRRIGKLEKAIDDHTKAIDLNEKYDYAYFSRGKTRREAGDLQGAIADFSAALAIDPIDDDYFYERGVCYFRLGDYETAVHNFSSALGLDAISSPTVLMRAACWHALGKIDNAIKDCSRALEINGSDTMALSLRGQFYFQHGGCHENAIADANRLMEVDESKAAEAFLLRWKVKRSLGDELGATEDLTRVIELNPALVLKMIEQDDKKVPNTKDAKSQRESIKRLTDAEASERLRNAWFAHRERGPNLTDHHAVLHNNNGVSLYRSGQFAAAIREYDKAIDLNNAYAAAYNNRAQAKARLNQCFGVISDYNKVLTLPRIPEIDYAMLYSNRSLAKGDLADARGAESDLTKAIELAPDNPSYYRYRAMWRDKIGDTAGARSDMEKVAELER